jgi:hypothetical protein
VVGLSRHVRRSAEFITRINRYELDVGMGHLQAFDLDADPLFVREHLFHASRHFFDCAPQRLIFRLRQVKERFGLEFGNYQDHTGLYRVNIQKGKGLFVLINFMSRELSFDDFGVYTFFHELIVAIIRQGLGYIFYVQ